MPGISIIWHEQAACALLVFRRMDSGAITEHQAAVLCPAIISWFQLPEAARVLAACDWPLVRHVAGCFLLVQCSPYSV